MKKNKDFIKFLFSLYKAVKVLAIVMVVSMMISQVFNLVKQYIINRLSALQDMDYIVVIENGKIVDKGTPKEIIPKYDKVNFEKWY